MHAVSGRESRGEVGALVLMTIDKGHRSFPFPYSLSCSLPLCSDVVSQRVTSGSYDVSRPRDGATAATGGGNGGKTGGILVRGWRHRRRRRGRRRGGCGVGRRGAADGGRRGDSGGGG